MDSPSVTAPSRGTHGRRFAVGNGPDKGEQALGQVFQDGLPRRTADTR